MTQHIDTFVKQLIDSCEEESVPVNMTERCKRLGLDIIGQFGFGHSLRLQTEPNNRFLIKGMAFSNYRINAYMQFPLMKRLGMEIVLFPFLYFGRKRYFSVIQMMTRNRIAAGTETKNDLFSNVVDAKDPETGEGLSLADLWHEAVFLFVAGMNLGLIRPIASI
jgi:hypothetical protein